LVAPPKEPSRSPTARDLIEFAGFGQPDAEPVGGASPLGLSPDGRFVATVLQRADLGTNSYCQLLVLIDLDGVQPPRILDRGGGFIMTSYPFRGIDYPNGFPRRNVARWSSDGRAIAYLKHENGISRLWLAEPGGEPARPITPEGVNVDRWVWSEDGRALFFATEKGRAAAEAAIDREGTKGWRYDARFDPGVALRPQVIAPLPETELAIDVARGTIRSLSPVEHDRLKLGGEQPLDAPRITAAVATASAPVTGPTPFAPRLLRVRGADGRDLPCDDAICRGKVVGLWWDDDGRALTFLRYTGWHDRYMTLFRWVPGGAPQPVLRTDDDIQGCLPRREALICVREGAVRTPRIVAIDRRTGASRDLFDPNPGVASLTFGRTERIEWKNDIGHEVYGDLALPPGYRGGRLPLIIVQYSSRGFLRGGTGNEFPAHLLAARGFTVLIIDKPDMAAIDVPGIAIYDDVTRANTKDWAERRSTLSAIVAGVDLLVARGIADPERVGITGLSDGASSARFAIINSRRFAAAAIASCCIDEEADATVGPAWEAYSKSVGYPPAWPVDTKFWKPYAFALNADRVRTPLLMQLADSETLMGLHAFTALKAGGAPVDLYVFPNETHVQWQPLHRAAAWERTVDWFSFWLLGEEDPDPAKRAQYDSWRALRPKTAGGK